MSKTRKRLPPKVPLKQVNGSFGGLPMLHTTSPYRFLSAGRISWILFGLTCARPGPCRTITSHICYFGKSGPKHHSRGRSLSFLPTILPPSSSPLKSVLLAVPTSFTAPSGTTSSHPSSSPSAVAAAVVGAPSHGSCCRGGSAPPEVGLLATKMAGGIVHGEQRF